MADNEAKLVSVGCKLPHGIVCKLKGKDGTTTEVILKGANAARIVGGYGITENVPSEFIAEWLRRNAKHPAVENKHIFVHNDVKSAESIAKENRELRTGLESIDPVKSGMLKNESGVNDPGALAKYNELRANNPERNRQEVI